MISKLQVEVIDTAEALSKLKPEWNALFHASGQTMPFYTFEWADCWWRHLRQDRRAIRDELQFRALRSETGQLVAIAPILHTVRLAVGPFQASYLQFIGADAGVTELSGMLCLPGMEQASYDALRKDLQSVSWDWIRWSGLYAGTATETMETTETVRDLRLQSHHTVPVLYLTLPASWEEFRAGLKRNIRESLRKCYNSMKRDGHAFSLRIIQKPEEVSEALERFFRLHKARTDMKSSVPHADVFYPSASRCFLQDVCARLAEVGVTRIFEIMVDGEVVATRIGFQFADSLYLYYSGYDPAWGQYSIMTTTVAEVIKYAICQGLTTVNLSPGRDVSKTRWGPSEVIYEGGALVGASLKSRLAYAAYQQAFRVRNHKALFAMTHK